MTLSARIQFPALEYLCIQQCEFIQVGNLDDVYLFELVPPANNAENHPQLKEITSSDENYLSSVSPENMLKQEASVCR